MTCALSGVTRARTPAFVAIGGCLVIKPLAFFIGCGAVGEADGRDFGLFCGAFVFGGTVGEGRRIWALAKGTSTSTSTSANTSTKGGWKRRDIADSGSGIGLHALEHEHEHEREH